MQLYMKEVRIVNAPSVPFGAGLAFTFGAQDALHGERCVPEMYFQRIVDKCDYCRGFESVAGPTLTTQQFLGLTGDAHIPHAPCGGSGQAEDTLDLEDDILDREFWASGNW